jgi:hypothetical protein
MEGEAAWLAAHRENRVVDRTFVRPRPLDKGFASEDFRSVAPFSVHMAAQATKGATVPRMKA